MSSVLADISSCEKGREAGHGQRSTGQTESSYRQILKSSALIGGSSACKIILSILRTKALALLLGPGGIGLMGLYSSVAEMAQSVSGMGINSSGVRQIAAATATGDNEKIAKTITVLRRVASALGCIGALVMLLLAPMISKVSFGDHAHNSEIALLGVGVLFVAVSNGQLALIQGLRRIADLARANIVGAFLGMIASVLIIWWRGEKGIVFAIISVSFSTALASWWYSRKLGIKRKMLSCGEAVVEASTLLKFGTVLMSTSFMTLGAAYLGRIIVFRNIGAEAVGFYQAAWSLGGIYVGFILQAMASDFFPRLTASAFDNRHCNRMVNEQAEVGLLLAIPGVLATLTFAPFVMELFYSGKFRPSVEILRWTCLGMVLRVASWPLGFILLAKGAKLPYFCSELVANCMQVFLIWLCVSRFGVVGTGVAFLGTYIFYLALIYAIARTVSDFRWSAANKKIAIISIPAVISIFAGWYLLPHSITAFIGVVSTIIAAVVTLRNLWRLVPLKNVPRFVHSAISLLQPGQRKS